MLETQSEKIPGPVRVRIAPSPTGFAHVGTAYTMLFNYAFAKKNSGTLIVRLEDTDTKRHVQGAEEAIYSGLEWLGFSWDEGPDKGGPNAPYRSSERLELYKKKVESLLEKDLAYESDGAIRFRNPNRPVNWKDLVRGEITFPGEEITDFVILKSDGYPTYNFAVVVDDIEMKISHVIRGEEHISNTPRQLVLYDAFGKTPPLFAHFSTLRNAERKKLSKRRDPVDLRLYREAGYLPEALVNFLCLFGWSHPEEKEVFTLEEFINLFTLGRIRKAGPIFDTKKLDWINKGYIANADPQKLARVANNFIAQNTSLEFLEKVIPLVQGRISKLSELEGFIKFFWERPQVARGLFENPDSLSFLAKATVAVESVSEWSLESLGEELTKTIEKNGFKVGDFYMSLRIAITGTTVTPPINESMVILGKDETLYRLREAQKASVSP